MPCATPPQAPTREAAWAAARTAAAIDGRFLLCKKLTRTQAGPEAPERMRTHEEIEK